MDDYREKVSKIKSTLNFLKSDLIDKGKNAYNTENNSKENYLNIPIQKGNKDKNANIYNDYTNNLNTEETDYTYNLNKNNYNLNNNNINNNIHFNFKQEKVNENFSNLPYLDTHSGNSEDLNREEYATKEIKNEENNNLKNKNFKRNNNSISSENKDDAMGYLKNIKEEMKKFSDYNFDFEKMNKNQTPEFKEVENKLKLNTQNIQEANELYYNNNSPFNYDYTYTLNNNNNENNICNKDLEFNEKKNDLFNDSEGVIDNNSRLSHRNKYENLQYDKNSGLENQIQELRNQIEDLKRKNLFLEKKLTIDQGKLDNPIIKLSNNNIQETENILIEEIIKILKVNQDNEIIPKLKMIMKNKKSEKLNQEFVEKLKDLYKTLITNENQDQENIDIKTIWRWIKSIISQMRNYAELVSENDRLKIFERNSRFKKDTEHKEKQIKSHSANKIIENKRINNSKNKLITSTEKKTFKIGIQNNNIKNKTNIYESFCKDLMKEYKLNNLEHLKSILTNKTLVSQKDKEKINAVKLLLEKSINIFE